MLYAWLDYVHVKGKKRNVGGEAATGLLPHLQEVILAYCLRVIDQSKLKPPNDSSPSPLSNDLLPITALSEAIRYSITTFCVSTRFNICYRILTKICDIEPRLVPRLFPTMKKVRINLFDWLFIFFVALYLSSPLQHSVSASPRPAPSDPQPRTSLIGPFAIFCFPQWCGCLWSRACFPRVLLLLPFFRYSPPSCCPRNPHILYWK